MLSNEITKFLNLTNNPSSFDQQTDEDINLHETFEFIDHTTSAFGKQYFCKHFLSKNNEFECDKLATDIKILTKDALLINKIKAKLDKANSYKNYFLIDLLYDKLSIKKRLIYLSIVPIILYALGIVGLILKNELITFLVLAFCINIYFYVWCKQQILYSMYGLMSLKYFLKLHNFIIENTRGILIHPQKKLKTFWLQKLLSVLNLQFGKEALDIIVTSIIEIIKCASNIEFFSYLFCRKSIINNRSQLIKMYKNIGYVDMLISIDELQQKYNMCKPEFTNDITQIRIYEGTHPLISNCKANSYIPKSKDSLVTGANMSGKTIYLKQIALNIILAQKINLCFAKKAIIPNVPVYTYLNINDNLLKGKSYYYRELERINDIIERCKSKPGLIILDEIFKGTNRNEQISMGYSVLKYLSNTGSSVIATTHDIQLLESVKNFNNYYFEMKESSDDFSFDHIVKEGKTVPINAIKLAEKTNLPNVIIEQARETYEKLTN